MKIGPVSEAQVKLVVSKGDPQRTSIQVSGFRLGSMKTKSSLHRLQYLDWVRGLGALITLQGHVFDSLPEAGTTRHGGVHVLAIF